MINVQPMRPVQTKKRLKREKQRVVFGLETEEETGVWRKLHNEELHNLCSLPNITMSVKSKNRV